MANLVRSIMVNTTIEETDDPNALEISSIRFLFLQFVAYLASFLFLPFQYVSFRHQVVLFIQLFLFLIKILNIEEYCQPCSTWLPLERGGKKY